jgi:type I restriction enzyme S subunit
LSVQTLSIEEATERLIDYRGKTPPKVASGVRLLTAKVIKDGRIIDEPAEYIATEFYDEWMRRGLPRAEDVLVTTEAPLGEVAILGASKVALAQRVILLRAKSERVLPRFLYYALQSDFAQAELRRRATGTTVAGIKQSELRQARIPWFPIEMQHRIAWVLTAHDDLIENNLRRIKILDEMLRVTYVEWFGGNGASVRLGDLAEDVRRNVAKGSVAPGTKYVGLEHIPRRSLALDIWEEIAELGSNKLEFKKGEILFGKIRPYFHKVCVAPFDGVCSADTIVIRPKVPEDLGLVAATVSSDAFVRHATATSNGSKMPRANWTVLREYPVPISTPEVGAQFTRFLQYATALQQNLVFQNVNLRASRGLLLPRLMSGQLSIADLNGQVVTMGTPESASM